MKTHIPTESTLSFLFVSFLFFIFSGVNKTFAVNPNPGAENFTEYKGFVVDRKTGNTLPFANLTVVGSNVSTVTNSEGEFSIKISKDVSNPAVVASFMGYKSRTFTLTGVDNLKVRIELEPSAVQLPELNVISKDAEALMRAVLDKKGVNYLEDQNHMTAFYREAIKKNKTYVSLSEAVVEINKQPYTSYKSDALKLYKVRKQADYSKLDTVAFKLQGGPVSSLYLDIMKNTDMIFTNDMLRNYEFRFDRSTYMDKRPIYVIDFKQRAGVTEPLYYGKIYIDAKSLAMKSAVFELNLTNREEATQMFIVKKPFNADVYPVQAAYRVDYNEKDGKWYYGYSRIEFGVKINWKRKLFNTNYFSVIEMAVTDWEKATETTEISPKDRLRSSVIVSDAAEGFRDPQFWGEYNVIEPEKSIESAIKKIQKQLEKK